MVHIKGRVKCYTERFKSFKGGWMPFFGGNALNFPMGKQVSLMKQNTHAILAQVFEPEVVWSRTGEGRSQMPEGKKKEDRSQIVRKLGANWNLESHPNAHPNSRLQETDYETELRMASIEMPLDFSFLCGGKSEASDLS